MYAIFLHACTYRGLQFIVSPKGVMSRLHRIWPWRIFGAGVMPSTQRSPILLLWPWLIVFNLWFLRGVLLLHHQFFESLWFTWKKRRRKVSVYKLYWSVLWCLADHWSSCVKNVNAANLFMVIDVADVKPCVMWETELMDNNNNVHLSCTHQCPERSHDTY